MWNEINSYTDVALNERHVFKGFADTMCAVCTIRTGAASAFNLTIERSELVLCGYGGKTMATAFSLRNITASIAINGVVAENVQLLVVPNDVHETDLLIGRTYTESKHIAYVRKYDKLVFGYGEDHFFL